MFILNQLLNILSLSHLSYSINVFKEPLNEKEEQIYLEKMFDGDKEARSILIEHNLRLVAHIVKKYEKFNNSNSDDLISIGTIGLIKGIDSYKKDKQSKLVTYIARCIENEILMYFRSNKKNNNTYSLNDSIGYDKDGNEINLIDIIKGNDENYLEDIQTKDDISKLMKYLNVLDERELEIIIKRYGLYNTDTYTQKEIAKQLKISRSYVSRIETRALSKLYLEFKKDIK